MKFLLLAFPLLALALSLSGLCNAQSAPFSSQNTTPTTSTTSDCTVNVTIGRNYIRKINTITQVALESFGRNTTIFLPLTTPLTIGLTQRPIFTRTGPNMTALSSVVTANGQAMKQLAGTLETIAQDWASSESTYQATYGPQPNASERRQFIASINNITRTQLHQLGRNNSRLLRITDPLSATLLFSQFTSLGYTLFNANQNIDKTGGNLRGLADTLEDMARKWSMTTAQFLDQEAILCQSSSSASVSRAVPEQQQFDQQCLASRPTNRSFITALNENTQKTLTAFGQSNLRLQSLSTALWLGLRFSTLTQRGFTAYNYNQNISVTGAELKAFAEAILEVTRQWEAAEVQFARDSNRDCRLPSATPTTTDPLINPRVMPNTEAPVTAAPAEVVTTSSLAPSPVTSAVSQASTTAAPVTPSAIVEASTSTASVAPEEAAATTTVSPAVSQTSTTAAAPVTSAIRETSTSTASPVSTTAAPSVIVEASTSAVVPSTASVAPEEAATTAAAVTTVSSVTQTSTAAPVTSVIRETSTSTVNPETSSPVTSAVSQVSLASTTVAPSVIVEASTSAAVPSTASVAPEDATAAAAVTTVSPVSQTSTSSAAPVTSVIVETHSSTVVPGTATVAEESSSVATEAATEVATQLSLDTTVSPLQENFIN